MLPKYEQIKQDLLREIKNHTFIPGDKFYSEADIKRKYAVSSITAVKALNELTSAGYLYRIQGKGTFVSKSKISQNVKFSDIELLVKEPLSKDLTAYASVYERVRKDFSIDLFSLASVETNEIVFPEDAELLNLLQLSFREPAVKQVKHSYLADGSVAEYIISYKHWKYFKTKIEVEAE